jgi:hypothetical protein
VAPHLQGEDPMAKEGTYDLHHCQSSVLQIFDRIQQ